VRRDRAALPFYFWADFERQERSEPLDELSGLYVEHLRFGLMLAKNAMDSGDFEWARAEIELNHNLPSLIEETNFKRHSYFWNKERTTYVEWASGPGHETAASKMRTYYLPLWKEMERFMTGQ